MMLDHFGESTAAAAIVQAIEVVLEDGSCKTPDMGGTATTTDLGKAIEGSL
jgi:tartrate dehydrogenase/decarboxylase/D-malate dehydrogenase